MTLDKLRAWFTYNFPPRVFWRNYRFARLNESPRVAPRYRGFWGAVRFGLMFALGPTRRKLRRLVKNA